MYLYSSKVFDTVSVGILISKLGKTWPLFYGHKTD